MQTLERTTFQTSRLLEFFTEKELQMQIGTAREQWPIALLKEPIDNSLDACETAGMAPEITVTLEPDAISVQDNRPGLPGETLAHSLNYLVRVSDKAHYVSPSRGQLGNALKCVWATPYVCHGQHGQVEVSTKDATYLVDVTLDRIKQEPVLTLTRSPSCVKTGTLTKIIWTKIASYMVNDGWSDFYNVGLARRLDQLLMDYAAFNPHATFHGIVEGHPLHYPAAVPEWRKWLPSDPTSPYWYTAERLRGLIVAYLSEEDRGAKPRTLREFVSEFRGFSGTSKQKAVTEALGLSGARLGDLIQHGDVDMTLVKALLEAMQRESRPVKPALLGVLGKEYVTAHLVHRLDVTPESVAYRKCEGYAHDVPLGGRSDDHHFPYLLPWRRVQDCNGTDRQDGPPPLRPVTRWIRVVSIASARVIFGRMVVSRRASLDFPAPGGPRSRRL